MAVTTITILQDFHSTIAQDTLTVVDLWAEWCGPCRMVSPTIDALSEDYAGKVTFLKVNVDDIPEIAQEYGIQSIPTIILFKANKEIKRIIGAYPKDAYIKEITDAL